MRRLLGTFAVILTLSPLVLFAQDRPMMPMGRWWKSPDVAKRLNLTAEQQENLDRVFTERSKQLIDLKASMEKSALELRSSLERFDSSPEDVMRFAAEVGDARSALFRKEMEMMLDIRGELDEKQWTTLRMALEQRSGQMRDQMRDQMRGDRRPPGRPNMPPK